MSASNSELYERLRFVRKYHNWKQEDVALIVDLTRAAVSQWEQRSPNRRSQPSIKRLTLISEASGFSLNWLIDDKSKLTAPAGLEPIGRVRREKKQDNPIVARISVAASEIAELSEFGGSDEVLVSTLQILTTYRRAIKKAEK